MNAGSWLRYQRFMWPKRRAFAVLRVHTLYTRMRRWASRRAR